MANPTYLQALSMENPQLINELKSEFDTLRANSYQNKYPCIYLRNQTCYEFIGKCGGTSSKASNSSRPKYKFKSLPKRHYVAHVLDFVFRIHRPSQDYTFEDSDHNPLELSHLCHHLWCVNPSHLVRETHAVNCQRRDECSPRHCKCVQEGRYPVCEHIS